VTSLSIWTFDSHGGAADALRAVERLQTRRKVAIEDAAVVAWPEGSHRPHSYQVGTADGGAALTGAFWGMLFGMQFLLPLTGAARGAESGASLSRIGLPEEFLLRLRERVTVGTSALFLLTPDAALDPIGKAVADGPTECLVSALAPEHEHALRRAFGADDDATP
jgi:uncharacterized membrane protein